MWRCLYVRNECIRGSRSRVPVIFNFDIDRGERSESRSGYSTLPPVRSHGIHWMEVWVSSRSRSAPLWKERKNPFICCESNTNPRTSDLQLIHHKDYVILTLISKNDNDDDDDDDDDDNNNNKYKIKELQTTAVQGTLHVPRKVVT